MSDDNVFDMSLRRAQQRVAEGAGSEKPSHMRAAQELCELCGRLAGEMPTAELLIALHLTERSLMVMLAHAIGTSAATSLAERAKEVAYEIAIRPPEHYRGPTVFDHEKGTDDDERG